MREQGYIDTQRTRFGFSFDLAPAVKLLLIVHAAVFLLQVVLRHAIDVDALFGLAPAAVVQGGAFWQPFTYFLLHASVWQLIVNALVLWMFGSDVERAFGTRQFALGYVILPALTGICSVAVSPSYGGLLCGPAAPMLGILTAFGLLFPSRMVTMLILLVFPVTLKAKYLAAGFILLELVAVLDAPAFASARIMPFLAVPVAAVLVARRSAGSFAGFFGGGGVTARPRTTIRKGGIVEKDIDPILDKISREGIHSLTGRERKMLEEARRSLKKDGR
ncbi:MAG TPA: rhomboid family intramembrane serine protease [bacterium]|nr:rhomboid family intramembrane serine protease [bacterium]